METISSIRQALPENRTKQRPIRVLQFGEGNFLRAFVDDFIDIANEQGVFDGNAAIIKPIPFGNLNAFHAQENTYTVCLRGKIDGRVTDERRVITCVEKTVDAYGEYTDFMALAELETLRFIVSNTTEAGIAFDPSDDFSAEPPKSYPGKLTKFLHARWQHFNGDSSRGLILLPVELIEDNGGKLLSCVRQYIQLWNLPEDFARWVENDCVFCSTLVDRIVTGYPKTKAESICRELGYEDALLDVAEPFGLWVIEDATGRAKEEFPLDQAGLPVIFTEDQRPYRERKVRILNGTHTSTVLAGYLMGHDIVAQCMEDPLLRRFMETAVLEEIVPTVPLPRKEAEAFAASVFERFENPFVKHALLSISLNSVSKWKTRILPSLKDSLKQTGRLPKCLTFSFAALLSFYTAHGRQEHALTGSRPKDGAYPIQDTVEVLDFFEKADNQDAAAYVQAACAQTAFWGEDLSAIPGFAEAVTGYLTEIRKDGMETALGKLLAE